MEFRYLRYFVAVAEELHFTRAAERLHMAQPPLSQQIRKLEREIGTELFYRHARGVELTAAGKLFYDDARHILDLVEQARDRAQSAARGRQGHIRVGFAGSLAFHPLIAMLVQEHRRKYPEVQLTPAEDNIAALLQALEHGRLDLLIIRQADQGTSDFRVEALEDEEMLLALPASHPMAGMTEVDLASMRKEVFILFPRDIAPDLYDEIMGTCMRAGFTPRLGQPSPQMVSSVSMVASGFGVAMVPRSIQQLQVPGVRYTRLLGLQPKVKIVLVCRKHDRSPVVANFIQMATSLCGSAASAS
ncbi:LysR family transcriptional regulator [Frateuria aurantia]